MSYLDSQQQAATKVQLDYAASTDLASGVSLTHDVWTDLCSNQAFMIDDASSVVEIAVSGLALIGNAGSPQNASSRLVIDSAGTPINKLIGGGRAPIGEYTNVLSGSNIVSLTGLSVGSHTVKIQVNLESANGTLYCRAASEPNFYSLQIRVLERKVMPSIFSGPSPTTKVQLDYALASDINGTSLSAATWTDVVGNQTFTVDDPASVIEISVSGHALLGGTNIGDCATRIVLDSAGTPVNLPVGGNFVAVAAQYCNPFAGANILTCAGLAAGTHTLKVQAYSQNADSFFCRPVTNAGLEFLNIRVLERKQTAALVSNCMVKLDEVIVGAGGQANIQFSSIPQIYKHLHLKCLARCDVAGTSMSVLDVTFNGDSTAGHYNSNGTGSSERIGVVSQASASWMMGTLIDIFDYASSSTTKTAIATSTRIDTDTDRNILFWTPTSATAITSILLFPSSGNFVAGSVCSLYGIV